MSTTTGTFEEELARMRRQHHEELSGELERGAQVLRSSLDCHLSNRGDQPQEWYDATTSELSQALAAMSSVQAALYHWEQVDEVRQDLLRREVDAT